MKKIIIGLLCVWNYAVYANDSFPPTFTAQYKLYAEGFPAGRATRSLTAFADGKFLFETVAETTGFISLFKKIRISERSRFKRLNNKIQPLEYTYRQTGHKDRFNILSFNWSKKIAINSFKNQTKHIRIQNGMLDRLLYQLVLMQELKQGKRKLQYKIADKGKVKTYTPIFLGKERINTGVGTLNTLKYKRISSNKKRSTTLWCAPSLHYLPVKVVHIEKNGDEFSMILKTVRGL
jgi:hypothetical protein